MKPFLLSFLLLAPLTESAAQEVMPELEGMRLRVKTHSDSAWMAGTTVRVTADTLVLQTDDEWIRQGNYSIYRRSRRVPIAVSAVVQWQVSEGEGTFGERWREQPPPSGNRRLPASLERPRRKSFSSKKQAAQIASGLGVGLLSTLICAPVGDRMMGTQDAEDLGHTGLFLGYFVGWSVGSAAGVWLATDDTLGTASYGDALVGSMGGAAITTLLFMYIPVSSPNLWPLIPVSWILPSLGGAIQLNPSRDHGGMEVVTRPVRIKGTHLTLRLSLPLSCAVGWQHCTMICTDITLTGAGR